MKTKEEIIEELKLELNPGSKTVDDIIVMLADSMVENQQKDEKIGLLTKEMEEAKKGSSMWYGYYNEKVDELKKMAESLETISRVVNEVRERWKK